MEGSVVGSAWGVGYVVGGCNVQCTRCTEHGRYGLYAETVESMSSASWVCMVCMVHMYQCMVCLICWSLSYVVSEILLLLNVVDMDL